MGFRDNLRKKMEIDRLAQQVRDSLAPSEGPQRIDRNAMETLLAMTPYTHHRERDLDLYCREDGSDGLLILVLDNGLSLYRTTIADVVLRKSPTLKEMVNIRNAIKILNDKDVVISRRTETLRRIQAELIDALDLSYTPSDIEALTRDGCMAINNNYADGIIETITLFCELLGFQQAPKPFQAPHHHVWGAVAPLINGQLRMVPVILFNRIHNQLKMLETPIVTMEKASLTHFEKVVKGDAKADYEGAGVLESLKEKVLSERPSVAKRDASHSVVTVAP